MSDLRQEVARRKAAAIELGLPELAQFLCEKLRFYPSISNAASDACLPAVKNARGFEAANKKGVIFEFNGCEYVAGVNDRAISLPDGDECTFRTHFLLNAKGDVLLEISGSVDYDDDMDATYRFDEVSGYVPGDWTDRLRELESQLKSHDENRRIESGKKFKQWEEEQLRKNFGL